MSRFKGRDHYRETLTEIDSEMHDDDIKNLKFLSVPSIPKKYHTKFTSGLEIFEALEKCKKISENDVTVLVEILDIIGRVDLSVKLKEKANMHSLRVVHGKYVDSFYILLFKLSEELTGEELVSLRYRYGKVPKREQTTMGIDLFSFMLQHLDLSQTKLNILESMLDSIHRNDLVSEIRDYTNKHMKQGNCNWSMDSNINTQETEAYHPGEYITAPTPMSFGYNSEETDYSKPYEYEFTAVEESMSSQSMRESTQMEESDPYSETNANHFYLTNLAQPEDTTQHYKMNAVPREVGIRLSEASYVPTPDINIQPSNSSTNEEINPQISTRDVLSLIDLEQREDVTEYYKMNAEPRGICLIIDNQLFNCNTDDVEATHLGNRVGSEKDCEALKETFERLRFVIDIRKNKKDFEMAEIIKQVSSVNHSSYDCFVCCILSHGGDGFVFGTNGKRYRIKELINQFSAQNCHSLAGKPKLFFLQSCRGKNHRPANVAQVLETDAPRPVPEDEDLLPPEADFLLGYATVSDAVSYRSKSTGTFYISELTKALNKFADRDNLLGILTRVNNEVSRLIYAPGTGENRVVYKQIPAPQFTLRKCVKFL